MTDPYGRIARWYDTVVEPLNAGLRVVGLKFHCPPAGARVLDMGCGTGTQLDLYQRQGCRVVGVDPSSAMLRQARRKLGEGVLLLRGDAACTPFAHGAFDLVLISLALHEMSPPVRGQVLDEARRLIGDRGRVLLVDYHPGPLRYPRGPLHRGLILLMEILAGAEHFRNFRSFLAGGGVPPLAAQHSLRVEQQRIVAGGNLGLFLLAGTQ